MSDVKLYTRRDLARLATIGIAGMAAGELAAEFPSSVGSRRRGLLALKAINWKAIGGRIVDTVVATGSCTKADKIYDAFPESARWKTLVLKKTAGDSIPNNQLFVIFGGASQAHFGTQTATGCRLRSSELMVFNILSSYDVVVTPGDEFFVIDGAISW